MIVSEGNKNEAYRHICTILHAPYAWATRRIDIYDCFRDIFGGLLWVISQVAPRPPFRPGGCHSRRPRCGRVRRGVLRRAAAGHGGAPLAWIETELAGDLGPWGPVGGQDQASVPRGQQHVGFLARPDSRGLSWRVHFQGFPASCWCSKLWTDLPDI